MNIDYTLWPNVGGILGEIKTPIPTTSDEWPDGDALVGNIVFKNGLISGFVDTKALTVNESKSTIINYDYIDIELPFTEGEIAITRGSRSKYFNVRYNPINDENVVITLKYKGCKTVDDVIAVDPDYLTNDIVDRVWSEGLGDLTDGTKMFYFCENLKSFSSDLSSLTNGEEMFYGTELASFNTALPNLTNGNYMFGECRELESFSSDLPSMTDGRVMFYQCYNLKSFSSDLSSLTDGYYMFGDSGLESFNTALPNLTNGEWMFYDCDFTSFSSDLSSLENGLFMFYFCKNLKSFSSDLYSLTNGSEMFKWCDKLTSFRGDLSSLTDGGWMFDGCKLDTASVQNIADTINDVTGLEVGGDVSKRIDIYIGNSTINEQEEAAFNTMVDKGWNVFVVVNGGGSSIQWTPTSLTPIDGEEQQTPIPFWAKPVPSDEQHAHYVDAEGNFYNILGGNFIYGDTLDTYGMFTSLEDAATQMRLTKYVKPVEKA